MVEIKFNEYYEETDLAGRSIAEVREQFKQEFGIPERAKARLNGKGLGRRHEASTVLCDEDELSFEQGSRKGLVMVASFLLALAITGGVFAYTFTTATATITTTADATADFAMITANNTVASYQPFGTYRGTIADGNLFDVYPASGYTGDLELTVYLSNPDELTQNYRYWLMRVQYTDNLTNPCDAQASTQALTMSNAQVSFYIHSANVTHSYYYVVSDGGSYMGLPWTSTGWGATYDPVLFAEITQAN